MFVSRRLLFTLAIAVICRAVPAYPQCEKDAERLRYSLQEVNFEGANAFPARQLRSLIPIASGDLFSVSKISDGLQALQKFYGERGYLYFALIPATQCDENRKFVRLTLILNEGTQFRLSKILILAPKDIVEHLYSAWPIKPGAIYDIKRVHQFLVENTALMPVGWDPVENFIVKLDERSGSVEVRINVCPSDEFCPQTSRDF